MSDKPIITVVIGDPAGIGPEIIAKAMVTGEVQPRCTPVLIGNTDIMRRAVKLTGVNLEINPIGDLSEASSELGKVCILDSGNLDANEVVIGEESPICGNATADWLEQAAALSLSGKSFGSVMGPINSESLLAANRLDSIDVVKLGDRFLFLMSGALRVVHIFDHQPLREVCAGLTEQLVYDAIKSTDEHLSKWGVPQPRIGVAGLNPHAHGEEEDRAIVPGVERAKAEGFDVSGPIAPDSVFRHCIEGKYDVVVAMFHDQGHIAMKTWGFVGNCAVILGSPTVQLTVAHGTAFDIAGKNIASHEMILAALKQIASFAAGKGFLPTER